MSRSFSSVVVMGLGKVGELVACLLKDAGFAVTGVDREARPDCGFPTESIDVTDTNALAELLGRFDAVVSCLPYHLNIGLATAAHAAEVHYFDLTEDVPTTKVVMELGKSSKRAMVPQCGLAPGFIGIVGASLLESFDSVRSLRLRVGALPCHPTGQLGYAFNWSPEGVVNEYLNDCEVLRDGKKRMVPAMTQLETILIGGTQLEAFTTSGGLGTMCDTYEGKLDELNYKTMRYPGHCKMMKFFFHELGMEDRRQLAGEILVDAKPPVNADVVYVHAAAEGKRQGKLFREEFVRAYYPQEIDGRTWRAISWTTAASVCAIVDMVAKGDLPQEGFISQEEVSLEQFFATSNGARYATTGEV